MYYKCSILIIFLFVSISSSGQIISDDESGVNNSAAATNYKANKIGVIQVKDSIFMLKGRGGTIGVSIGEDGVFIIDSQFPDASADIIQRVKSLSKKPIKLLVNTHHHGDHVGGNSNLAAEGAIVFSHEKARSRMTAPYMKAAEEKHQRKIDSIIEGQGNKISSEELRKKAVIDAELSNKVHFHSLRHSFISNLVQRGCSLAVVQQLAGHSQISVTMGYARLKNENLQSAVKLLDKEVSKVV